MIRTQEQISIEINAGSLNMTLSYLPQTSRTIFDICDINGKIVQTGQITSHNTLIATSGLKDESYILLILDGDRVCSRRFSLKA